MIEDIKALGPYTGSLRHLALRVKDGKRSAIERAANLLAWNLPAGALVIPMPSHEGRATVMLEVARELANNHYMIMMDALECVPHMGNYVAKKHGRGMPSINMSCRLCVYNDIVFLQQNIKNAYVIDNVIDTGATFQAARKAIPGIKLLALASTNFPITSQIAV